MMKRRWMAFAADALSGGRWNVRLRFLGAFSERRGCAERGRPERHLLLEPNQPDVAHGTYSADLLDRHI